MSSFETNVDSWSTLFTVTGTSSVTLLGLLFVGISLRMDIRKQPENSCQKRMTSQNLTSFLTVFLKSIYFLIPNASAKGIAVSIIVTTGLPLVGVARWMQIAWIPVERHVSSGTLHGSASCRQLG
jgi:glucan phosphoethanolaminetransferase (alkaline phosphatase superfamily)